MTHTPTPWTFRPYVSPPGVARLFDARGDRIGKCSVEAAEKITSAVNSHQAMADALREARVSVQRAAEIGGDDTRAKAFMHLAAIDAALALAHN